MSNSVAPMPSGVGVGSIAEHRPRRESEDRHQSDDEAQADNADAPLNGEPKAEHRDAPPPVADEEVVPAETLFATTLLANSYARQTPSPQEVKLRTTHGWAPPESVLRLKDKLI